MRSKNLRPARILAQSYGLSIAVGTILLLLPISSTAEGGLSLLEALFTATSATCVTGLSVITVAEDLTFFGQVVLLLLIQCGGMGLMILATMLYQLISAKMSFRYRSALKEALNQEGYYDMVTLTKKIVYYTFLLEGLGAFLLLMYFWQDFGFFGGLWQSIFHSVSAFNNAGFDLFGNSLENYTGNWYVNLVIMALIIHGGLGFVVIAELSEQKPKNFKGLRRLSLQSKVVLLMTTVLIVSGTLIILLVEWNNPATLGNLSAGDKILASIFQSVTCRTAGFNSIPLADLTHSGALMMMFLMFIGASPGSTGGGVKTTTFGIVVLSVASIISGRDDLVVMGRQITVQTVLKALAVIMLSTLALAVSLLLLSLWENLPMMALGFEVVSAFSTTGLTMGITTKLMGFSKIIIIILMFIGRTGPLTLAIALSKSGRDDHVKYPKGKIMIG